LKQNLKEFENNYKITKSSVDKFLQTSLSTYDIVFYDPPFKIETDVVKNEVMKIYNILNTDGFVVIHRHTASKELDTLKNYKIHKEKNYGQSNILILRKL
jgi:16S rRNA (guanine966-N2)-methyltransferase